MFLTGLILIGLGFPMPSPVRDAATLAWAPAFRLHYPFWHIVFSPFMGLADLVTNFSMKEDFVLVAYAFILSLVCLRRKAWLGAAGFIAFIAWGALVPRPMGRLVTRDPDVLLIDFHSHSQYSHDGRKNFTPLKNMQWHMAQGYDAAFITDHNRVEAAQQAKALSETEWKDNGYRSLQGEEVSLFKTHLVILGNGDKIDNRLYDSDASKIPSFIRDMHEKGLPVIASLPEYWFYHWDGSRLGTIDDFAAWGMDGFEIINSAPKALDFPLEYRRRIVDLCRTHHLCMTGISDNHGYGYATAAWNAMALPGWRQLSPEQIEPVVIKTLKDRGPDAVQVLERVRYEPQTRWQYVAAPLGALVIYVRLLQPAQAVSWVLWIWGFWTIVMCFSNRKKKVI